MNRIYRILLIEDLPSDAYLVQREIKKILGQCTFECVETRENFLTSLCEFRPDLIFSDFCIPGFDWFTAFKLAGEQCPRTPFFIVTGSTNQEIAADCIKKGVTDCISKLELKKLGPAILKIIPALQRELQQK